MDKADVTHNGRRQIVHLPKGIHLPVGTVSVRQEGESVILEPDRPNTWPDGFFDGIHIIDPAFKRPDQGQLPPIRGL